MAPVQDDREHFALPSVRLDPPRDDLQTGSVPQKPTFDESSVDASDHPLGRFIRFSTLGNCGVLGTSERKVRLSHRQRLLRRCTSYSWSAIGLRNGRSSPRATVSGIANTVDQVAGFEAQVKELSAAGCKKIFQEQVSSVTVRLQLQSALEFVRDGDVFDVIKLDRLARSVTDLMAILQALERKGVAVRILNLGMDTQTPTGKLMLTVLGGVAQFEREMMLERQREGIAKAKSAGKYKGRKPIAPERQQHLLRLAAEGATKKNIARQLGIGEATVYRILAVAK